MRTRPRVFTVPSSAPFLATLARALLDGELIPGFAPRKDPLALASATVYLPTRRATRAFAEALLAALGTEATLLPRIVPLGDADEDALAFAEISGTPERPSPVSTAERRLTLARLVLQFAETTARSGRALIASSPAAALQLADELAKVFDDLTIAEVSFERLAAADFIPEGLDEYWQRSFEFLQIARTGWDAHLADRGRADPVTWQERLLSREAARIGQDSSGPVIAAGSTGTIPAVARLIATIACHPQGAVVLPGLDQLLDEESFSLIEDAEESEPSPGHPQFGLKRLIARIGIERSEIARLGAAKNEAREALLSEAFRPAITTDRWRSRGDALRAGAEHALAGVTLVEAADPREEALALATAMRELLEQPGRTAALITPDRALARRVAADLRRWDIEVDDSGGVALAESEAGRLARIAVAAAAEELAPVTLVSLLRHPLSGFGPAAAIDALELAALRGPRPAPGVAGLQRAVADARALASAGRLHRRDARARLKPWDWEAAEKLTADLAEKLDPLLQLPRDKALPFREAIAAHRAALVNLGLDFAAREPADLRALAQAFARLSEAAQEASPLTLDAYADAFADLLAGEPPVRPPFDRNARLRILGPLEARLLEADRVLLGGLNEGTWPPEAHSDAWLNRPMRKALNLDLPERRIGLSAHDFAQAVSAGEVVLSRAKKQNGVETVASRFLQRLAAVTPDEVWQAARARGRDYVNLARALERRDTIQAAQRPAPKPPAEARPQRMSVTEIETLIRDPYHIYARHVLKLEPLDAIGIEPDYAARGTILHEAFSEFTRAEPGTLPPDALEKLIAAGQRAFAALDDKPGLHAVWWPRFLRAAEWLIGEERELRAEIERIFSETSGAIEFDAGGRMFRLTARADRIDRRSNGAAAIMDYKTGSPPTSKQALTGLAPQLPLEAAIAKSGGFAEAGAIARIAGILVLALSGGHPPGRLVSLDPAEAVREAKTIRDALKIRTCDDLADVALQKTQELIRVFADGDTPYLSVPRPQWRGRFGDYDHLARIKEWSANEEGVE